MNECTVGVFVSRRYNPIVDFVLQSINFCEVMLCVSMDEGRTNRLVVPIFFNGKKFRFVVIQTQSRSVRTATAKEEVGSFWRYACPLT